MSVPESFFGGQGWCDECQRLTPLAELDTDSHTCLRCRGADEPFGLGLTPLEADAVVSVEVTYTDSWEVSRADFDGDDNEWRELVAALSADSPTDEQRKIIRRFKSDMESDFDTINAQSDTYVDLIRPRKRAVA